MVFVDDTPSLSLTELPEEVASHGWKEGGTSADNSGGDGKIPTHVRALVDGLMASIVAGKNTKHEQWKRSVEMVEVQYSK